MPFEVKGKVALITGGIGGIGIAFAQHLLKNGLKALTIADVAEEKKANEVIKSLNAEFGDGKVIYVKTDVTKADQFEAAFKTTIAKWGSLDILLNNAGILKDSNWELEIAVNCNAVVRGCLLALQYMGKDRGGKGGVVVNLASILGLQEVSSCPIYVGTKHFVVGLTRSFGKQFYADRTGINFFAICPGVTDTVLIADGHKCLLPIPRLTDVFNQELKSLPIQDTSNVGKALITLLQKGENGSIWVTEESKPAYEVNFPDRKTLAK